ncbi:MAG: modified peptide precursor CbpA [Deltaproteobacteria bacterium]|nr:modified peptide precursor CbpA [Deltaproteobacteria bacterium]
MTATSQEQTRQQTSDLDLPKENTPDVIAFRKSCDASGTGLSHYILTETEDR